MVDGEGLASWHRHPSDKVDFNWRDQLIEVKTTAGERREHTFSLSQLDWHRLPMSFQSWSMSGMMD